MGPRRGSAMLVGEGLGRESAVLDDRGVEIGVVVMSERGVGVSRLSSVRLGRVLGGSTSPAAVFVFAVFAVGTSTVTIESDAVTPALGIAPVSSLLHKVIRRGRFVFGVVVGATTLVADIVVISRAATFRFRMFGSMVTVRFGAPSILRVSKGLGIVRAVIRVVSGTRV